jgi:protocatechuate 3,4-dioxygenase beta subunit
MTSRPVSHDDDDVERGLQFDLSTMLARRSVLKLLAGGSVGAALLAACSSDDAADTTSAAANAGDATAAGSATEPAVAATDATPTDTVAASTGASATADATSCALIPEETPGPFPGDGSNGPDVLAEPGVVRRDIRSSVGSATGTAEGVEVTVTFTILDTANGCAPLTGAAMYMWHCDREGRYSMYSDGVTGENYLRGVQAADAYGQLTFTTVFPGCYDGRWPHIHFEIYASVEEAVGAGSRLMTSQLAFDRSICEAVYATNGYESSVSNLSRLSIETDNIFADGVDQQLATVAGTVGGGLTATLTITV